MTGEDNRAQHLLCDGAEKQLLELATAPSAENQAICGKLTTTGNLSRRAVLADQASAHNTTLSRLLAPGFESFSSRIHSPIRRAEVSREGELP
jgi:hypothetical protein